jgi:transcriptional regulator with XRE-family HTH domain
MKQVNLALIKRRRKEMRITLKEMAEMLGFKDASTYYRYEQGKYKFDATHIPVVAKALKLKITEIFFDDSIAKLAK